MQARVEYYESDSNLKGAMAMKDILRSRGYEVFMSRVNNTTDDDLNLFEIHQLALNSGADVFFAIHSNSSGSATLESWHRTSPTARPLHGAVEVLLMATGRSIAIVLAWACLDGTNCPAFWLRTVSTTIR